MCLQAYPNPFSEKLNIEFTLPEDSRVKLEIFGITGERITDLFEGDVKAGALHQAEYEPSAVSHGIHHLPPANAAGSLLREGGDGEVRFEV